MPIPPNLKNLDLALENLITFFEIPNEVLQRVAQKSPNIVDSFSDPTQVMTLLSGIPAQEKDAFLLRVLQGDVHVAIELNNKIQERMVEHESTNSGF